MYYRVKLGSLPLIRYALNGQTREVLQLKILIGNPSYLFSVIGEQSRLQVLALLLQKPSFVEDIRKKLKVEETLLSKHLKALRDSGLVHVTRHGRRILYEINPSVRKDNSKDYLCLDCCEIKLKNI